MEGGKLLHGIGNIPISVSSMLIGSKKAVLQDGVLYVSPAMERLMQGSTREELRHLLERIELLKI